MSTDVEKPVAAKPRWDGSRVVFEIEVDGELVACAISRSALQDISGVRRFAPVDLLRGFSEVRARIEEIAASKFRINPESVSGFVSIWADDVEDTRAPAGNGQAEALRA